MGPVADENEPGACVLTQSCWHCISLGIITRVSIIVSGVIGFDVTDRPIGYLNCTESLAGHSREELIPKPNRLRFSLSWIERCVLRLVLTNLSIFDFLIERTDNNYFIPSKWCFESSNCATMNLLYEAWEIVMINMCILLNRKCDVCKFSSKTIDRYLEGVNEFLLRWYFFNFVVSALRLWIKIMLWFMEYSLATNV